MFIGVYIFLVLLIVILLLRRYLVKEEESYIYTISEIGNREEQEDSLAVHKNYKGLIIACLADGMGGLQFGWEASNLAVQTLVDSFNNFNGINPQSFLLEEINNINNKVYKFSKNISENSEIGSTFISAILIKKELFWISVGDSRIYLLRKNELIQMNKEHIYENILKEKLGRREITQSEFETDKKKSMLTSYIGDENIKEIDRNVRGIKLNKNDKIIICSDGLFKTLSENEIINILSKNHGEKQLKKISIEVKNKNKRNQDNMSVIVIEIQ